MDEKIKFNYYGIEADQFSFYRIPRILIKSDYFRGLSSDAKILYGLMLDRMSLSIKNGWLDNKNRAYIIYTIESVMQDLSCSKPTCVTIMKELDSEHGIGLIERKRRGLGKPDIIYVKNFSSFDKSNFDERKESRKDIEISDTEVKKIKIGKEKFLTNESKNLETKEVKNIEFKNENFFNSMSKVNKSEEVNNNIPNYINSNYKNNKCKKSVR